LSPAGKYCLIQEHFPENQNDFEMHKVRRSVYGQRRKPGSQMLLLGGKNRNDFGQRARNI
jgi:hypothetical protein